ncbi:type VII secretion protein EccE [Streptomyces sp. G44]|uniref:type VII secretion protein EccE n=1 Tax=Streptomyces sp. G44 TaxID=2807632 RepID=UPI00195F52EA|nr:type VII secretion protein EccE [Streptomyces sp. G44]MBM7171071.1 type VII secretion protein EccE [Streptomyces sp. G44]
MATTVRTRPGRRRPESGTRAQAPAAPAPAAPSPSAFAPRLTFRSPRAGWSRLRPVVLVELALALTGAAWIVGPPAVAPAVAVAAVLVFFALGRRQGRPWHEWPATARAFRRRVRRSAGVPVPHGTDPSFAPAVECDPALRTYAYSGRSRRQVGMVGDGTFLTVVLQVESDATALRAERGRHPLPVGLVREALEVDGIRLVSAQIVLHTQPAPALHLPQQSVAVSNYAPLQARSGAPAVRITWIALKLDPELCPEAVAARGGGLIGAQKCLVRAADQLSSRLTGTGFRVTVLDEDEVAAAVATSACANPLMTAQAGRAELPERRTEESPHAWRCDNRRHTTYWVRRWPRLGGAGTPALSQLVALLTGVPALATTFSLTLGRGARQEIALSGHVRVTGRSDAELAAARQVLERGAREAGTGLLRLDREQLPGMLATLPLGGAR